MRDVAARARVSFKTVSRVVNDEARRLPSAERRVRQADRGAGLPSERRRAHPAPRRPPDGVDRAAARGRRQPVLRGAAAGGGGRRRAARRGRALREPRRGPGPRAGAGQRRSAPGTSTGWCSRPPGTTSPTSPGSCGRARRSCASTGRRATSPSTRWWPPTTSAPPTACGTSRRPATGASPSSATGARSRPRRSGYDGYRDGAGRGRGVPPTRPRRPGPAGRRRASTARSPRCSRCPIRRPRCSPRRTWSPSARCARCAGSACSTPVALVGFDDFLLADLLSPGVTVVAQDPAHDRPDRGPSCCSTGSRATAPIRGSSRSRPG